MTSRNACFLVSNVHFGCLMADFSSWQKLSVLGLFWQPYSSTAVLNAERVWKELAMVVGFVEYFQLWTWTWGRYIFLFIIVYLWWCIVSIEVELEGDKSGSRQYCTYKFTSSSKTHSMGLVSIWGKNLQILARDRLVQLCAFCDFFK